MGTNPRLPPLTHGLAAAAGLIDVASASTHTSKRTVGIFGGNVVGIKSRAAEGPTLSDRP
jgi:hypothetical protein